MTNREVLLKTQSLSTMWLVPAMHLYRYMLIQRLILSLRRQYAEA